MHRCLVASRSSIRSFVLLASLAATSTAAWSCSSSDGAAPPSNAGTGGTGTSGTGGRASNGGASGRGGGHAGGAAGAEAGSPSDAGSAGEAGAANVGGNAGEAGESGNDAGSGGASGSAGGAPVAVCGDGQLGAGEACDDGNEVSGDGCVACAVVSGFTCDNSAPPSKCREINRCPAARSALLGASTAVASTAVTVISSSSAVSTVYVDASAGGLVNAANNPWVFVTLTNPAKVNVSDVTSIPALGWDLALKRQVMYTNGGDGGPGIGGAVHIAKDFAQVSAADAANVTFATEKFFDGQCNPLKDADGFVQTTFSGWFEADPNDNNKLYAYAGTFLVRSASGALFKLAIQSYYGTPQGGTTGSSANYLLQIAQLKPDIH